MRAERRPVVVTKLRRRPATLATTPVRTFEVPQHNFEAESYSDLIDFMNSDYSEPPLTMDYSNGDIQSAIDEHQPLMSETVTAELMCHTQAVERAVKLTTEASSHVCGTERVMATSGRHFCLVTVCLYLTRRSNLVFRFVPHQ